MNNISPLSLNKKTQRENYILVGSMIYIAGQGSAWAISDWYLVLCFLYALFVYFKRFNRSDKVFLYLTLGYIVLTTLYFAKFGWINYSSSFRFYLKLAYAYLVIKSIDHVFFEIYENYFYYLCLIALILYPFQLLFYDQLKVLLSVFENVLPNWDYTRTTDGGSGYATNAIFFTLHDDALDRNSGYAWEPKGFATLILVAIISNLIRNKMKMANKAMLVYVLALLTTLSTAGYVVFFVAILLFYAFNTNKQYVLALVPVIVVLIPIVAQLDFVTQKIITEFETRNDSEDIIRYYQKENFEKGTVISLGRFPSFLLDMEDLKREPLLGFGMQDKERTEGKNAYFARVNGLSDLMARWGILGSILYLIILFKGIKKWIYRHDYKGHTIIFVAFLGLFFASAVILQPLWLIFPMYGLIASKTKSAPIPHFKKSSQNNGYPERELTYVQ